MPNPDRITKVLNELERLWKKYPTLRFYQLLQALIGTKAHLPANVFYQTDKELLKQLQDTYEI